MEHQTSFYAFEIIGIIIGLVIAIVINTFSLRYATNFIAQFRPSYREALKGAILALLAAFATSYVMFIVGGVFAIESLDSIQLASLPLAVAVSSYVLGWAFVHPENGPIGFKKGFLTLLTAYFINVVVILGVVVVLGGLMSFL